MPSPDISWKEDEYSSAFIARGRPRVDLPSQPSFENSEWGQENSRVVYGGAVWRSRGEVQLNPPKCEAPDSTGSTPPSLISASSNGLGRLRCSAGNKNRPNTRRQPTTCQIGGRPGFLLTFAASGFSAPAQHLHLQSRHTCRRTGRQETGPSAWRSCECDASSSRQTL